MVTVRNIGDLKKRLSQQMGRSVGFVPTMGDLHEGHLSLIRRSKSENDFTVLSIFVNPIQFNQKEDFKKYHRDEKTDLELAEKESVDLNFLPQAEELVPPSFQSFVEVDRLSGPLCGAFRPGHFRGVATIVLKLFNLVQPTRAYFGLKDYQQCRVIEQMIKDLHLPVQMVLCPTVRDKDGLALSSRNRRLSAGERSRACAIFSALQSTAKAISYSICLSVPEIKNHFVKNLHLAPQDKIEYFEIVHPKTLLPLEKIENSVLLAAAVWIGRTRLIDHIVAEKN